MEINLTVWKDDIKKGALTLSKSRITVGRSLNCDVIVNDPSVSSVHFSVLISGKKVFVKDEGSINGTFLNGKQVVGETEVFSGDKITFCGYTIEVEFEGNVRESEEVKHTGNKTVVIEREDFIADLKKAASKRDKKRIILLSTIVLLVFLIAMGALMLIPEKKRVYHSPITVDMIDKYFLELEKTIDKGISDKASLSNAEQFFKLGEEKLKMKNLNKEAMFNALVYFLKAKKSIEGLNPKPPLWDKIIPAINSTKTQLKITIKKLFKDAWLLEQDGNKQGARDVYLAIMQTIPDENSAIYIKALRRYNLLK